LWAGVFVREKNAIFICLFRGKVLFLWEIKGIGEIEKVFHKVKWCARIANPHERGGNLKSRRKN
jgi:hypothetical protein